MPVSELAPILGGPTQPLQNVGWLLIAVVVVMVGVVVDAAGAGPPPPLAQAAVRKGASRMATRIAVKERDVSICLP